jgi:MFS family permease
VTNWAFAVRALQSRNYRLFFGGQSLSLIGTWMTRIGTSWLVYRLTGSAVLLGFVSFSGQIPAFFLAPIAGVWVDRWDRHRTLVVTQVASMLQSLALAVLALSGVIKVWEIVLLALAQGVINAFDMPARQAFVVQMVDRREYLGNAIALNSSMVNAARLIGPALAGMLIAAAGEGYCFLVDSFSYIAVIVSLVLMNIAGESIPRENQRLHEELWEGWRYVVDSIPIRSILSLLAVASLVGMPYTVLMPIFASKVLRGDAHTLGFLMAATGVGALAGALSLAIRKTVLGLGRLIIIASMLFGASLMAFASSHVLLMAFASSHVLWISLLILPVTGFGMMQLMASSNTILQTVVEDEKRGRVMAFYSMAVMGMTPFGSLLAGSLAAHIGAQRTILFGGALCMLAGLWFASKLPAIRAVVRPTYVRLGIIPELALGVQRASSLQTPPE